MFRLRTHKNGTQTCRFYEMKLVLIVVIAAFAMLAEFQSLLEPRSMDYQPRASVTDNVSTSVFHILSGVLTGIAARFLGPARGSRIGREVYTC